MKFVSPGLGAFLLLLPMMLGGTSTAFSFFDATTTRRGNAALLRAPLATFSSLGTHSELQFCHPRTRLGAKASENPENDDSPSEDESGGSELTSKDELIKAVGEKMRSQKADKDESNLLDKLNPFKAGQNLRKTVDAALTSMQIPAERKSIYYLDDRLYDGSGPTFTEKNPWLERLDQDDFVPEVLVIGATGEVGRLVVKRLLLEGRFRVRVLVRDLYTKTLNLLGTGVTYCQGDLANTDSLEYALTDVDKIVFCASAPRPDEDQFQQRFEDFMKETLESQDEEVQSLQNKLDEKNKDVSDSDWEQLDAVLEVRARLAEQVDFIGMQNVVRAYQNVRHSDYGTAQSAKRSLFKFRRPEDVTFFAIDEGDDDELASVWADFDSEEDESFDEYGANVERRSDTSVKTQCQWMRNQFDHGVFVGKIPKGSGTGLNGEAAIVSSRLRSRDDPENGIDLSTGFAGFICRLCGDGGKYEAFVRTKEYDDSGIEYVCEFETATKPVGKKSSSNKFITVRLPFENFKPVSRRKSSTSDVSKVGQFKGQDVRNIGFRYRSADNSMKTKWEPSEWSKFYLALSYIKLYRAQPEPEFVYVSDARIPPIVRPGQVRHEARQLVTSGPGSDDGAVRLLFDETALRTVMEDKTARSQEETYFKLRGEDLLRRAGLSYAIVRVSGYNEILSGEASTIDLKSSNDDIGPVSRADVAQVCVSALLDPNALNKSFYVSKKSGGTRSDEDMSAKFSALPKDSIP